MSDVRERAFKHWTAGSELNLPQRAAFWALAGGAGGWTAIPLVVGYLYTRDIMDGEWELVGLVVLAGWCSIMLGMGVMAMKFAIGAATCRRLGWRAVWTVVAGFGIAVLVAAAMGWEEHVVLAALAACLGFGSIGFLLVIIGIVWQRLTGRGARWSVRMSPGWRSPLEEV